MGKAEDRISNLPDSMLHHILSFLELKIVARTSVLSQRWNDIWNSIPNLEFKWESWNNPDYPEGTEKFMNYVDGILQRRSLSDNSISKFHLKSYEPLSESLVKSWISTVVRHNVKDFRLNLCYYHRSSCIPQSFFTCASLTSLQLDISHDIELPNYVSFPRLKYLRLRNMEVNIQSWNEKVFSDSPVLEELYLDLCILHMPSSSICISIPTVKILRMEYCFDLHDCALRIDAPRLVTFYYSAHVAKEYVFSGFPKLEEAVVYLYATSDNWTGYDEALRQFLRALKHVKCLTLQKPPLQVGNLLRNSPAYNNIKRLKITRLQPSDALVIAFLKVMPNLESLVVENIEPLNVSDHEERKENQDNEDDNWTSLDNEDDDWASLDMSAATGSLFLHLKTVCFKPLFFGLREISCVKVILKNAKALQSLTVNCHQSRRRLTEKELKVQIKSFPKASAYCRFIM